MPEAFRASGLLFGIFQLSLACTVNYISSSCLLYTSFEWNSFSFSDLAQKCSGKPYKRFVDLIFFLGCLATTLSYTVLIQGNLTSCCSFIRAKFWKDMPSIMDDTTSTMWVIVFAVVYRYSDIPSTTRDKKATEELDHLLLFGFSYPRLYNGCDCYCYF